MKDVVRGFLIISFLTVGVAAQQPAPPSVDVNALGPQVGETVPDFSAVDQFGRTRTLDSIMGPNGAMLVFNRSADW